MATNQKNTKNTGAKNAGAKNQAPAKKAPVKDKKAPAPLWQRNTGGALCFLLAVFAVLGVFQVEAVFIDLLSGFLGGLLGYGYYLMIPVLLWASYLLLFHREEKVALRLFCGFSLPVFLGAFLHIFLATQAFTLSWEGVKGLWLGGVAMESGGALGGFFSVLFTQLFSSIGAGILFFVAMVFLLLAAFRITPEELLRRIRYFYEDHIKDRGRYLDEDYYQDEEDYYDEPLPVHKTRKEKSRFAYDMPLDEPPLLKEEAAAPQESRKSLFNRNPRVKRPDQVLVKESAADVAPQAEAPAPTPAPPVPAEAPAKAPEAAPPVVERELSRSEKREIIKEHQAEVTKSAADALESSHQSAYHYPPVTLLQESPTGGGGAVQEELNAISKRLSDTIASFGIVAKISGVVRGPSITRYEVELEQGVRLNRLTNLSDDIALALGAASVRIAPIPGKISLVGIEVPNQVITPVKIREVISSGDFSGHKSKVSFAVGKDIGGNFIIGDASRLPHLLIAGTTGSGKSVCTNSLIISLLYKASPEEVRLIMVDPKLVELGIYNGIPHLLIPVVTDPKKAAGALQWAVAEMMKRYRMFSEIGVRDIAAYNAYGERTEEFPKLPQIVIVIDELADLMLVAAKEVEESICRVAQMGRAAGMHLIIATQRPSADVITGLMKANIPSRIAFAVASSLESRIILDTQGAEKLVGRGDMLWFPLGAGKPLRVQGCLIDDAEVASVVEYVKQGSAAAYDEAVLKEIEQHAAEQGKGKSSASAASSGDGDEEDYDENFNEAVSIVLEMGQASVSMLQRRLKLGYSRAARLVDQMEDRGIVGPFEGSKPRQLLVTRDQWAAISGRQQDFDSVLAQSTPEEEEDDLFHSSDFTHASTPLTPLEDDLPPWDQEDDEDI